MNATMYLLKPGASTHTCELGLEVYDEREVQRIRNRLMDRYPTETTNKKLRLALAGLEIHLVKHANGGHIYLKVTPLKLLDATAAASEIIEPEERKLKKVWKELHRRLKELGLPDDLEQYEATRIDLCCNLGSEKNSFVREDLRLMHRRLTPAWSERVPFWDKRLSDKENRICGRDYVRFETPCGALVLYDKFRQSDRMGLLGVEMMPKGVLRIEWQLTGDALRKLKKRCGCDGVDLIGMATCSSAELMTEYLDGLLFGGTYCKKKELLNVIEDASVHKKTKERMIRYIDWAGKHGEDKAAAKYMRKYDADAESFRKFRGKFERLDIQPVPLRRNYHEDRLEPPEVCLLRLLTSQ